MDPWWLVGAMFRICALSLVVIGLVGTVIRRPAMLEVVAAACWLLIALSLVVVAVHAYEAATAFSSDSIYERSQMRYRLTGAHAWVYWLRLGSVALPQLLWIEGVRRAPPAVAAIAAGSQAFSLVEQAMAARDGR